MKLPYTIAIQWSDEDGLLVEEYQQDGKPLPQPKPLVTISQIA